MGLEWVLRGASLDTGLSRFNQLAKCWIVGPDPGFDPIFPKKGTGSGLTCQHFCPCTLQSFAPSSLITLGCQT